MQETTTRRLLIINADDLGYSAERDKGIIEIFKLGYLSCASLLVNGESVNSAISAAKECGLPMGLHINFTEGPPIAADLVPSLVIDTNATTLEMRGKMGFREALDKGLISLEDIERELRAQLDWFIEHVGAKPTHADGHQHVNVMPQLAPTIARVLGEYGVTTMRISDEHFDDQSCPWLPEERKKFLRKVAADSREARTVYEATNIISTDTFMGLTLHGYDATPERISEKLNEVGEGKSVEWMVHPGYTGTTGDDFNRSPEREHEMNNLKSEWFHSTLKDLGYVVAKSWDDILSRKL